MGNPSRAALLRKPGANPATKDLPAVKEERFLNLPYAMWTSGTLNIDAAEAVRTTLEEWELAPSGSNPSGPLLDTRGASCGTSQSSAPAATATSRDAYLDGLDRLPRDHQLRRP